MPCPVPTELPQGMCQCGCGEKAPISNQTRKSQGAVKGEPRRFIRGHDKQKGFWERFDGKDPDECWLWTGATNHLGYGQKRVDGVTRMTHRLAWEKAHGSIPDDLEICHKCDVPACGNINHLFLGTHQENMADSYAKGRHRYVPHRGSDNGHSKLTEGQVLEIRARLAGGKRGIGRECAEEYGVSSTTITDIGKRKIWRHV